MKEKEHQLYLNSMINCKKCSTPIAANYCTNCGQAKRNKIDFQQFTADFRQVFKLKKGVFYTAFKLLFKPITMINEYLGGKTRPYISPIPFLIITVALNTLVLQYFESEFAWEGFMADIIFFTMVIWFIFQNKIFFIRPNITFYQHFVFATYYISFISLLSLCHIITQFIIMPYCFGIEADATEWEDIIFVFAFFICIFYLPFRFFRVQFWLAVRLFIPYLMVALVFLIGQMTFLDYLLPERNFFQFRAEPAPILFTNKCIEEVEVGIFYQKKNSKWEQMAWQKVPANTTALLQKDNEPLLCANSTVYLYAKNEELDMYWSGEHEVIFDLEEYKAYERDLNIRNDTFRHSIVCLEDIRKQEWKKMSSLIGKKAIGIEMANKDSTGIIVQKVFREFPAHKAGMKEGDVIFQLNQSVVKNTEGFIELLAEHESDSSVLLTYWRDSIILTSDIVPIKMEEKESE